MAYHVRIARPVTNLSRAEAMYRNGLGLVRLGQFHDHEGFDGVMLGEPDGAYHLEFTHRRSRPLEPTPTSEDLLVYYVSDRQAWLHRCEAMVPAGFKEVAPLNPYWAKSGRTFADPDAYLVVVNCASWTNIPEQGEG
jgi:hypothetical protein